MQQPGYRLHYYIYCIENNKSTLITTSSKRKSQVGNFFAIKCKERQIPVAEIRPVLLYVDNGRKSVVTETFARGTEEGDASRNYKNLGMETIDA